MYGNEDLSTGPATEFFFGEVKTQIYQVNISRDRSVMITSYFISGNVYDIFEAKLKFIQGCRKHLKVGGQIKKGHMTTPIMVKTRKDLKVYQIRFEWELKIIDLRVYLKNCYFI